VNECVCMYMQRCPNMDNIPNNFFPCDFLTMLLVKKNIKIRQLKTFKMQVHTTVWLFPFNLAYLVREKQIEEASTNMSLFFGLLQQLGCSY
jgi:hypothetical protein